MEKERIIDLLEKSFRGPAWHGPAVMEALAEITPAIATNKNSSVHSVIELVMHMAAWRNFVTRRLQGDNTFEVTEERNFPKGADWLKSLNELKQSQVELLNALRSFPEEKLNEMVPTRKYDFYTMLHGIIQHDIYHTGQIILLKRLSLPS